MATIKLKDESTKTFSIDGVCYTKGDYRLQYNAKKEVLIIPKAVANISNLSGLPFKNPTAWTYFVDLNDDPYGSFEEFSLAISDAINFNTGEATPQYKVYTALLTQSGTSAPTAIVLENTLGVDVSFTYFLAGNYFINATGAFTGNKTYVDVGQSIYATSAYIVTPHLPNIDQVQIRVTKVTDNTSSDNKLTNFPIEIRVYN